jgi:hypothetical protein
MEENHIVHENPRPLYPDGSSQKCECTTIAVRVDGGTSRHEIQQEWSSVIPEDRDHDDVGFTLFTLTRDIVMFLSVTLI